MCVSGIVSSVSRGGHRSSWREEEDSPGRTFIGYGRENDFRGCRGDKIRGVTEALQGEHGQEVP